MEKAPAVTADVSKVTIVTGASSGIGRATARLFAQRGDRVVLAARSIDQLNALKAKITQAGGQARVVQIDLSTPEQAETLIDQTVAKFGRVDVLVNNAGYGTQCRFVEMSTSDVARMFNVNVVSAMSLARSAAKQMLQQGAGSIVNVSSVGGVVAHPLNVAYCASKHALVGFSKSLRLEMQGTGVRVTAVCPGASQTGFFDTARRDIPFDDIVERFALPPDKVAKAIVKASTTNRAVVFPSWGAWFLAFLDKWFPRLSAAGNLRYRDKVLKRAK